jgi:hypothetical protein
MTAWDRVVFPLRGMSGAEPGQHGRELFGADVEMFDDSAPEHGGRDIPTAALQLGGVQDLEHDALATGETVAHIGQDVARVDQARGFAICLRRRAKASMRRPPPSIARLSGSGTDVFCCAATSPSRTSQANATSPLVVARLRPKCM